MTKIRLLDGATGTRLWELAEENGYEKVPVWKFNIEHPELVLQAAAEYAAAGSDILYTNTFAVNRNSVKRSSSYRVDEVVSAALQTAKKAVEGTDKKIALSFGPLHDFLEPYGDLEEEEAADIFEEMLDSAVRYRPDYIVWETFLDLHMLEVAAKTSLRYQIPVICSMSFEQEGRTIMNQTPAEVAETLSPLGIHAIGANCSLGPKLLLPVLRELSGHTDLPLLFKPNAGVPTIDSFGREVRNYTSETFLSEIREALPLVSYLGGCCGTDRSYIAGLRKLIDEYEKESL